VRPANLTKSARFGVVAGASVAVLVATVMAAWDWLENPGGIFRGPDGTDWGVLLDTLTSWLFPTFLAAASIALLCHLAVTWIRHAAAGRGRG
jgi:hypothetical protein